MEPTQLIPCCEADIALWGFDKSQRLNIFIRYLRARLDGFVGLPGQPQLH